MVSQTKQKIWMRYRDMQGKGTDNKGENPTGEGRVVRIIVIYYTHVQNCKTLL